MLSLRSKSTIAEAQSPNPKPCIPNTVGTVGKAGAVGAGAGAIGGAVSGLAYYGSSFAAEAAEAATLTGIDGLIAGVVAGTGWAGAAGVGLLVGAAGGFVLAAGVVAIGILVYEDVANPNYGCTPAPGNLRGAAFAMFAGG
jgi:hypothetical protein